MIGNGSKLANLDDTIVALSTPPGPGLRAVIRLSGPTAARVVRSLIPGFLPDPIASRQIVVGEIELPRLGPALPVELFYFRGPATYTGQDLVEIHTLSSMPLIEIAMAELLTAGARGALPGEFTMRGFLAGKLDLTRAEAVHAVIEASGGDPLRQALAQLAGGIARPLDELRNDMLNLLADVEAGLDFTEEDLTFVDQGQLLARLARALALVTLVGKQTADRGAAGATFRVVLAGSPNAGKSSLFNALVGRDSALVSPIAGTTRDYLEADVSCAGVVVRLIDTAGHGSATDSIDAAAQELGRQRQKDAELVLWCQAVDDPAPRKPGVTTIGTKADLGSVPDDRLAVSVFAGRNIERLKAFIAERARTHAANELAPSLTRCRHHIERCLEHLRRGHRLVLDEAPAELLALELRLALDELGAIVGAVYTDDLLDRIFSRFCIGK